MAAVERGGAWGDRGHVFAGEVKGLEGTLVLDDSFLHLHPERVV